MRKDKNEIIELRKQGKSYREIQKTTGASRSTLCDWFKNEGWSKHTKSVNNNKNIIISKERLQKLNDARKEKLNLLYKNIEIEAENEFEIYKNDPLFIAGLMLYDGEGDHLSRGDIRLANVNFDIHKIFIGFAKKFLRVNHLYIKFSILLYPDLNIEECVEKWSSELNISRRNIYKPQIINGKLKTRKLHFGVGTTIILSSFLKRKLFFWIEKIKKDLIKNQAGII